MSINRSIETFCGVPANYANLPARERKILEGYDTTYKANAGDYFGALETARLRGYKVRPVKDRIFDRRPIQGVFSSLQDSSE